MANEIIRVPSMHPGRLRPTRALGTWWLREPGLRMLRPTVRKALLVDALAQVFPHRVLVLTDLARHHGAHVLPPGPLARRCVSEMLEGHWALCFFAGPPDLTAVGQTIFPAPAEAEAQARLARLDADAAIWSWPDDLEWLVAVAPHEVLEGPKARFVDVLPFIPRVVLELVLGFGAIYAAMVWVESWMGPGLGRVGGYLFGGCVAAAIGGTAAWIGARFFQRIDARSRDRARPPRD